jgi:hypothetical protein
MTVFKSLIRFFKIVRLILADNIVSIPKSASKIPSKELLIVKTDAIGDYILFRNLLPYIRNSKRFQGYKIVLLGNVIWKDLAEFYDKDFVDEFI